MDPAPGSFVSQTIPNPNPVSIGGKRSMHPYTKFVTFEKGVVSSTSGDPLMVTKVEQAWFKQICEWCGNSLSLSLCHLCWWKTYIYISMTPLSHKMCEQHRLSLIIYIDCDHTKCQVSFAIMQVRYPKNIQPTRCTYINPLQLRPRPHHLQVCFSRCQARQSDPASDHGQSLLCSGRLRKSVRC